jgi:hypothetical protein
LVPLVMIAADDHRAVGGEQGDGVVGEDVFHGISSGR